MAITCEADWLACDDPAEMLTHIEDKVSGRKLLLHVAACWRSSDQTAGNDHTRRVYEDIGKDGACPDYAAANAIVRKPHSLAVAWANAGRHYGVTPLAQAALLREIVGNPFVPAAVEKDSDATKGGLWKWLTGPQSGMYDSGVSVELLRFPVLKVYRSWLTPQVRDIAAAIYEEGRWGEVGVLADALEEAGCQGEKCQACHGLGRVRDDWFAGDEGSVRCGQCGGAGRLPNPILEHLRQTKTKHYACNGQGTHSHPGLAGSMAHGVFHAASPTVPHHHHDEKCAFVVEPVHVRGCWAIDLLTGRE